MDGETTSTSSGRGRTTRFTRSAYEIIEEFSDAVFASALIIPLAAWLADLTGAAGLKLLSLVTLWFWIRFLNEVVYWQHETFTILETENGRAFILKRFGVFNVRTIKQEISRLTVTSSQSWFDRIVGVERVTLFDSAHQFVAGRRMPLRFKRTIDRIQDGESKVDIPKPRFDPAAGDSVTNRLVALQYAMSTGLIDPKLAKIKANELVGGF